MSVAVLICFVVLIAVAGRKKKSDDAIASDSGESLPEEVYRNNPNYKPVTKEWTRHEVPGLYRLGFPPGAEYLTNDDFLFQAAEFKGVKQGRRAFTTKGAMFTVSHLVYSRGADHQQRRIQGNLHEARRKKKEDLSWSETNVLMGGWEWSEVRIVDEYGSLTIQRVLNTETFIIQANVSCVGTAVPASVGEFFKRFEVLAPVSR